MTRPRVLLPGKDGLIAGRYQLDELLGEGGIGVVYAGTDIRLGRPIAVKLLRPHLSRRPDARARFEREARVASQLRHTNAVKVYDFGDDDGALFLVMERLIGTTTWHELHAPPATLTIERVLHIAYCVADVLAAAHDIKLVHRDIKPDNIFVERAGDHERIVVVDFGMAFIAAARDPGTGRLTKEGLAGGTPEYMSPEQAADTEVGPAADIYNFGCVLYELCTGLTPFRGNIPHLLSAHMYSPAPRLRARRADVPEPLDDLCARMLSKAPVERPTAREIRHELAAMRQRPLGKGRRRRAPAGSGSTWLAPAAPPAATRGPVGSCETLAGVFPYAEPPPTEPTLDATAPVIPIAVVGDIDADILFALSRSGLQPYAVTAESPAHGALAVLAIGADIPRIARLIEDGVPVVADAHPEDLGRITTLFRVGVASIASLPLRAGNVIDKLNHALARLDGPVGDAARAHRRARADARRDVPGSPDDFGVP